GEGSMALSLSEGSVPRPNCTRLPVTVFGSLTRYTLEGKGKPHCVGTSGSQSSPASGSVPASGSWAQASTEEELLPLPWHAVTSSRAALRQGDRRTKRSFEEGRARFTGGAAQAQERGHRASAGNENAALPE